MSTPSSSKQSKSCAVSGCTEPRLHRNYCAKHQNASLGKSDPLRVNDLDACVNWILEAINKGVDAMHKNSKSDAASSNAASSSSIPIEGSSGSSNKSQLNTSTVNEYLQLLQPYTQQMLDNIRNPNAPQPLPSSSLDIFSFSTLSSSSTSSLLSSPSASTSTLASKQGATPPRPNSTQAEGEGAPPSPDAVLNSSTLVGPIVDIKVQYTKQKKKTPAKYEMLEKSVSGKYEADVNKSGNGKPVTLCYQRGEEIVLVENTITTLSSAAGTGESIAESETSTNSESENGSNKKKEPIPSPSSSNHPSGDVLKPITSLSLIFRDACEEPPYGFSAIERNATGGDANLNYHESSRGRQVYLCVHRGEGAPIYDLGLIHHDKRETLPVGFHELKHTPFGNRADLNAAMSSSSEQPPSSQAVYLCFRPHVTPVLRTYLPLLQDAFGTDSVSKTHLLYAKVLALLTAILYSYDQKMVLHALEGFMRIPPDSIPPALLNRFLQCVCDAAPCFQTYFTTQAHTALLKFLFHSFKTFYQALSIETFAKILEVCFLTRHEDKQNEISEGMIALLIAKIEKCKPCVCSVAEKKEAQHIGMNAVAGGEGHSKPAAHSKPGDKGATGTTADGTTTKEGVTPAVSSVLCSDCQWKKAVSNSPLPSFAREIILQLATRVCTAKELESEAKGFQRHTSSSPEFRSDIAKLTAQLQSIDKEFFSHIDKISDPASGASSFTQSSASSSSRPNSSGAVRPSPLNVEPDAANGSAAAPPTSAAASASAVAFDELHGARAKVAEKDRLFYPLKEERFLSVATLICAKFAGEAVSFGLVKSEQMKRKLHALRLLFYILHHGVYFFRSTPGGILLVRRFVCPALMNVCVTDNNLLWRLLLQTFTVLYDQYRSHLMIELGVFFDHILLSLLESTNVTFELKKDVLDMWHHILGKTPQNLVNLFYNYDNHSKNWTIFERLNTVLARISEGEQKSFVPVHVEKPSSSAQANPSGQVGNPAPPTTKDQAAELAEQQEEALQRQALKLLVHNLHMLAQWVGVPGLKRSPDIPSKPVITEEDDVNDDGLPRSSASPAPDASTGDVTTSVTTNALSKHRASRIDTWSFRHDKQKADQKILQEALKLARTEKLKSALQYLRIVDPAYAQPKQIAHFLYTNEGLDKAEVGDFLGSCGDKFMSDDEYESLRAAYLEHLDFTGLLFDQGLRLFLCDSGFRLPGEAQKIDRLLEAFCVAFCRDNPNVFRNHSSAFIVSFALVMLNTDLHDSRLRSGASRRQPMTEEQFIGNLRGVDDKRDFPRSFLETLYRNIAAQAIEWKEKKPDASAVAEEKAKAENQTDIEKQEDQAKAVRKTFEITVRRALAYLKNQAPYFQGYNRTSNTMIAAGMFEVVWYRIISVITLRSDNCTPGDVELLHICLEGLAYGSSIAICLGLPTERQAFSRQLAKISFIERNRDSIKASNMHLRIVQGEHLKQDWYRPFNLLCEKSPARACHVVFDCAHDIKQKINYERRQAKLRQIESDFNHEIVLVDPARSFVREGQLIKLSNSSQQKKQVYVFFLFNDLILYASEGMNSKWKCHRVIHLSLCRLEDLRGIAHAEAHAFRIVSPQKSFVVSAPTKEKKQQWMEAIYHHLKLVMAKRKKYLDEAKKGSGDVSANAHVASAPASSSPTSEDANGKEELLRRYSTFIGQSDMDLNGKFGRQDSNVGGSVGSGLGGGFGSGNSLPTQSSARDLANAGAARTANHCKLCIRPWAIFRRKQKCRFCGDSVCNDCCGQKCMIPGGEKRLVNVCDACYGALKGMVNAEQPLLTVCDA